MKGKNKLIVEIPEGKGRPIDAVQSAKLSSEIGIISRQFISMPTKWKDMKDNDKLHALERLKLKDDEEPNMIDFFKATHYSNEKGWTISEAQEKYEKMVELQSTPIEEGAEPNNIDDIMDEVLCTRPGYIPGLGYGPKPKKTNSITDTIELKKSFKNKEDELNNYKSKFELIQTQMEAMRSALLAVGIQVPSLQFSEPVKDFIVYSDASHSGLGCVLMHEGRCCWLELLKDYACKIDYHPGKVNVVADAVNPTLADEIKAKQILDSSLLPIIEQVEQGSTSDYAFDQDRVLCFKGRYCVSDDVYLRHTILNEPHSSPYVIHFGGDNIYQNLREIYHWVRLKKSISDFVAKCLTCHWKEVFPLDEFAYNNSHQASIRMSPYEALYGHRCHTLICWVELLYCPDPIHIIQLEDVELRPYISYDKELVQILDRDERILRNKIIPMIKL
ncbi:hypothetical protein F3Y22_tig00111207pilonHSYRG00012 [Hibiscus syriacus]|uniref:Integrase zinc-binding domain-containing protein n=1 Tax=Hibiscus syriacus TaxID=106335 RepID=A0A6A2YVZ8_HIBSY|nr:hypothetical protein F3Y22_tig00111207pilonHSYRG00012 [Hibiscus syriacus]